MVNDTHQDLSTRHEPVGELFPNGKTSGVKEEHRLTEAQVQSFRHKRF